MNIFTPYNKKIIINIIYIFIYAQPKMWLTKTHILIKGIWKEFKMKLICSKANLVQGVNIVMKAVPSKTTMAILECILIDASTNEISLQLMTLNLG